MRRAWLPAVVLGAAVAAEAGQSIPLGGDLAGVLGRVGARVEEFYARARTVTSKETARFYQLESDFRASAPPRQLVYELRWTWDPPLDGTSPEASVVRRLVTVNGRPPRPKDEPRCEDPKDVTPDSLSMLLPANHDDYEFKLAGASRVDNRTSISIDFRSISKEKSSAEWNDTCVNLTVPRTRGRIWVDAANFDVLRLDQHLPGMVDFEASPDIARRFGTLHMALERHDSSIRYREVRFDDPQETLTLPRLIETTSIWRGIGVARHRRTQEFSDYRRFITGARILGDEDLR